MSLSLSLQGLFDPAGNNQAKGNRQVSCLAKLLKCHDIQCLQNEQEHEVKCLSPLSTNGIENTSFFLT